MGRHMTTSNTVFISYAREDSEAATKIVKALKDNDIEVWFDRDSLLPGQNWKLEIEKAIPTCRYFITILSHKSVTKRGVVQSEIRQALDVMKEYPVGEIFLIPVRLDNCTQNIPEIRNLQWVDMFPDWNAGIDKLLTVFGVNVPFSKVEEYNIVPQIWAKLEPDLQDALALAYNQSRRYGANIIRTRYLFAAIVRLRPKPLDELLDLLPASALPEPISKNITAERHLLREHPALSACVEHSLKHLSKRASPKKRISSTEVFVDIARHGTGNSVARLRTYGVSLGKINQIIEQLGWTVIDR